MVYLFKFIRIFILLGIIPTILGMAIERALLLKEKGFFCIAFSFVSGILAELSLFALVCIPMAYSRCSFSSVVSVYTIAIVILTIMSIVYLIFVKKKEESQFDVFKIKDLTEKISGNGIYVWLYIGTFIVLFFIQIYFAIYYSGTYIMDDDATYIAFASDALQHDTVFQVSTATGTFSIASFRRMMQSIHIFYAYVAKMCDVTAPVAARVILNVVFLVMAYAVYYMMAVDLFITKSKKSKQDTQNQIENVWVFMIFISILYIFGYYSHYSHSFRLLVTLWQGKAVLATVVTPFLFIVMKRILIMGYRTRCGMYILMLSLASVSLSLMAVSHLIFGVLLLTIIVLFIIKDKKILWYTLWGLILPIFVGVVYFIEKI